MKINFDRDMYLIALATLLLSIKPFEYLATNISVANFNEDLIFPLAFHLIIYFIYVLFFILFLRIKNNLINKFFIALAGAYYLQYYFLDISDFVQGIIPTSSNNIISYLISTLIILFLSTLFSIKFFSSKNKHNYLVVIFLLCISQIGILGLNFFGSIKPEDNKSIQKSDSAQISIKNNFKVLGENIYYIILDGMTSYKYFEETSNQDNDFYDQFNINLEKNKFKISMNSFSSYNTTYLTLASIFELDYFDKDFTYSNRSNFFPQLLYKKSTPKLIDYLNALGYEFRYYGNQWAQCSKSLHFSCPDEIKDFDSLNLGQKISIFLNNAGIKVFTQKSVLGFVLRKFISFFIPNMANTDGLEKFTYYDLNSVEPFSGKFYFIHNLAPHPPYPNENCEIDYTKDIVGWINFDAYTQSIKCTMKKTLLTIDSILLIDPTAIIVVQGDHGPSIKYDGSIHPSLQTKRGLIERFSIHNSIRLPDRCNASQYKGIGNVETINLVMNCVTNKGSMNFENKSYVGFYETNKELFGTLVEVTDALN